MKKTLFRTMLLCMAVAVLFVSVCATAQNPGNGLLYVTPGTIDKATATITRCSCTPVDNYLYCGVRAQYLSGTSYEWEPSQYAVEYDDGYDVYSCSASVRAADIVYAKAFFRAFCGDANAKTWEAEWND